jgi:NADH-quinone oxidoreductase subunit L
MLLLQEAVSNGPQFFWLVPWIVLIPIIGLLFNILFGSRLPEKVVGWAASLASGLAFVIAVLLAITLVSHPEGQVVPLAEWIHIGDFQVRWAFQVDTLSVVMMLLVSGVGTLIHIYSIGYMHEDVRHNGDPKRFRRFFVYMNLFIAAMMILVSSDNYLMLFVGWEGVGLCSFLLIGFWFEKGKDGTGNAQAAKKAMIANRIGDFGVLLALFIMFWAFGSLDFHAVFEKAPQVAQATPWIIAAITVAFMLGVTGKSAQIPLYVWLPDAMAGPTPVSALIHAATMVTAGVYLITRSASLFNQVPQVQNVVALIGAITALFAATIAVGQFDIKKVLAYSTVSQLGFMVAAVGMGAYTAGMFHLVAHAFFKGLLFLASGSVILGVERGQHHVEHDPHLKKSIKSHGHDFDPQDMRNMGGMRHTMKITFWVYLIGSLALAGIFPFAGFWSKDEILLDASVHNRAVFILLLLAAFLTAFYMTRQVLLVFFGKPRSPAAEHAKESPPVMTVPLIILAILSVFGGILNLPGIHSFGDWLERTIEHLEALNFSPWVAVAATLSSLVAFLLGWWLYSRRYNQLQELPSGKRPDDPLRQFLGPVFTALNSKWWVDELYQLVIIRPYVWLSSFLADQVDWRFWHDWFHEKVIANGYNGLSYFLADKFDKRVIDGAANGLASVTQQFARGLRRVQTGYVRNYALSIFFGLVVILAYLFFR